MTPVRQTFVSPTPKEGSTQNLSLIGQAVSEMLEIVDDRRRTPGYGYTISSPHGILMTGLVWSYLPLLYHLSQRLIVYQWSSVRPSSTMLKHLLRNHWANQSQILSGASIGRMKVCSQHLGHMTEMAATSIYGKNPNIFFSGTNSPIDTKLGM